jgi:thiamine biosynthesis lipoprotein
VVAIAVVILAGLPGGVLAGALLMGPVWAGEVPPIQARAEVEPPTAGSRVTRFYGQCFGPISYRVTVGSVLDESAQAGLAEAIQRRLDDINEKMSTYRSDSDVSRFNRDSSTEWMAVDRETAQVVSLALEISRQTEGAFDVTVGPLVALWKFGPAGDSDAISDFVPPTEEAVAAALAHVGFAKLAARLDPPALKKQVPTLEIDLSAVAKGYAVDQVAELLEAKGHADYFVEVGEEVRAAGKHPAGRSWICGIEKPLELQRVIEITVPVQNLSIATSGDYRQFHMANGRRYSHTIDPRSGYPTDGGVALASVAAEQCAVADAWATAAMVLGVERTQALADPQGLGLHLVGRDEAGQFFTVRNDSYPAATVPPSSGPNWVIMVGATIAAFGLALAGMSIGVIFKRKPLAGSCGGLANMPQGQGQSPCELCSNPSQECREFGRGTRAARQAAASASNADTIAEDDSSP